MQAARVFGPRDLRYGVYPDPVLRSDEVLVRVRAAGICATDVEIYRGDMPYFTRHVAAYPINPGHEWAGEVEAVGADVTSFVPGEHVVGECSLGCRACAMCLSGRYHLCPYRQETGILNRDGAFAELLGFPAAFLHRVDRALSFEEACLVEPSAVAANVVRRTAITPRDTVAVVGAGPIGLLTLQMARVSGATRVILIDPRQERLAVGKLLGADATLHPCELDGQTAVQDIVGDGCSVVIEATGHPAAVPLAFNLVAVSGRIGMVGIFSGNQTNIDLDKIVTGDITVIGSLGSPQMWPSVIELLQDRRIQVRPIISHILPLVDIGAAFAMIERGASELLKIIVQPN